MTRLLKTSASMIAITCLASFSINERSIKEDKRQVAEVAPVAAQKIQVAILLDVSGSMQGLIEQAKAQLWNMVSVMGKATCATGTPQIEIALYEYGRTTNDVAKGYIRQLSPFTTDLDSLSQTLFSLTTNGGDEYCGQVIRQSVKELPWDANPASYKVIFIAGNEDFLQGAVTYTEACKEASQKGLVVNTIYCGPKAQGIREHWNLGGECGAGSFTSIDHNAMLEDIPTPYDSALLVLNCSLNNTYVAYGYAGRQRLAAQASVDQKNYDMNKSAALKRVTVKSNKNLYKNEEWDLVDAVAADSAILDRVSQETLPDNLKGKSKAELKEVVITMNAKRSKVQTEIGALTAKREAWLAAERKRLASAGQAPTLESEIEKLIREQAKRFGMTIQ